MSGGQRGRDRGSRRGLGEATSNGGGVVLLEVGSSTPRGWASREEMGPWGRDRGSRRGLGEATSNGGGDNRVADGFSST